METIKKYWFLITVVFTGLSAAVLWVANIDSKTFDDPEQKVEHINHVKYALTPEQQQRKYILDSIEKTHRIKSRRFRDSLDLQKAKRDSLTAVTIYQIKQELKALKDNE